VFNGDVGTVETIDAACSELTVAVTSSGEARGGGLRPRVEPYGWGELRQPGACLRLQRSTRARAANTSAVVIPLLTQHSPMLQAHLVYTRHHPWGQAAGGAGGAQEEALAMAVRTPKPPALHQVGGWARLSKVAMESMSDSVVPWFAAVASLLDRRQSTRADSSNIEAGCSESPAATATSPPRLCTNSLVSACSPTRPSSRTSRLGARIRPSAQESCWVT